MNYKVIPTPEFIKNLKTLKKKYKNIKNDILELANELEKTPTIGTNLGNNTFKVRIKNSDNNKGKNAGYRIITYCINDIKEVFLVTIYSKSEKENILELELKELIARLNS
jgi:mRNA-degrading endonuclease RelE of RelBE toxin-antitoxin system